MANKEYDESQSVISISIFYFIIIIIFFFRGLELLSIRGCESHSQSTFQSFYAELNPYVNVNLVRCRDSLNLSRKRVLGKNDRRNMPL
jgi:hypothetical protein